MKLASFFLLSVALHATALTYPLFFFGSAEEPFIPVVVLALGEGSEGRSTGKGEVGGEEGRAARRKHLVAAKRIGRTGSEAEKTKRLESRISMPAGATDVSESISLATYKIETTETLGTSSVLARAEGEGTGGYTGRGDSGTGVGSGKGHGTGGGGSGFAQVSYAYNPKPVYPERARREGWEGTVLLRVLVDEEGKSKSIEIDRSSGFEALDYAAVQTVKRWRFSPARYGEGRVDSWVKIPIVFRLADLKD